MLTYIPNNNTRTHQLFALSTEKECGSTTSIFNYEDIYEVMLNPKDEAVVVLTRADINNVYVRMFIDSMLDNSAKTTNKIFVISDKKYNHSNIINIAPNLFKLFNSYYKPQPLNNNKKYILCHLDCTKKENNELLKDIVYPANKDIPVKLVNCYKVRHPQNLGLVDEQKMLDLIYNCYALINTTDHYVYDAIWMQKPIVSITSNEYIQATDSLTLDQIEKTVSEFVPYKENLSGYRVSSLIKHYIK